MVVGVAGVGGPESVRSSVGVVDGVDVGGRQRGRAGEMSPNKASSLTWRRRRRCRWSLVAGAPLREKLSEVVHAVLVGRCDRRASSWNPGARWCRPWARWCRPWAPAAVPRFRISAINQEPYVWPSYWLGGPFAVRTVSERLAGVLPLSEWFSERCECRRGPSETAEGE